MQLNEVKDEADKVCIVGAGSSGPAAAKVFAERVIPLDCLQRENGYWRTLERNQQYWRRLRYQLPRLLPEICGFEDFPMPDEYPTYLSRREALAYLRDYAQNFGILDRIQFNTSVESAVPADEGWHVKVVGE